ncbi:MAG: sporulation protein YqfD [Clostridia bacterium]|nr:sporulation protein YqfD [Clostridia bacterium]
MLWWTRLRIEGTNINRQFDKMIKSGITAKDIKRQNKKCIEFCLPASQLKRGIDFFASECYNVLTINNALICTFVQFLKKRFVFALCFALMVASLFVLQGYIWKVDISGDMDERVVQRVLDESGFVVGIAKNKISLDEAENLVCNKLPQAKYAIVSIKGSTLFVKVFKKQQPQNVIDFNDAKNLYACCDGIISRIVVVSGTPRVQVGDQVKKGQLLIEGVRTNNDQTTQPVRAVGQVFADVNYVGSAKFNKYKTVFIKTGKSKKVFGLSLFGFKTKPNVNLFENQIKEEDVKTFFPLPIKITTTTVYQTEKQKQKDVFDEKFYKDLALKNAIQQGVLFFDDVVYEQVPCDDGIVIYAKIKAEKQIDTY